MRYRLLGPLSVSSGDGAVSVASNKRRAILGALLLEPNRVLSVDQLVDAVWGAFPPASAVATLRSHICNLRKVTGDDLRTHAPGYLLSVADGDDDVSVFRRLVREGTRSLDQRDLVGARERIDSALALWRGRVLADVCFERPPAAVLVLEELRLTAIEDREEIDLALGRHREVIAELRTLVEEHPLRESLHRRLMLALYQSGRQAEALQAYELARRRLRDELGIEPSPMLQQMDQAILRHDPLLEPPRSPIAAASRRRPAPAVDRSEPPRGFAPCLGVFGAALQAVLDGSGSALVVVGATPELTSTFLDACCDAVAASDALIVRARSAEISRTPLLGPWLDRAAEARPVVVVLEELDRADEASIGLVRSALAAAASRRVLFVAAGAASNDGLAWGEVVRSARAVGVTVLPIHDRRAQGAASEGNAALIDLTSGPSGLLGGSTHTYAASEG